MKDKVINDLLSKISDLEFEVEKQEQRIDKAIEYIKKQQIIFKDYDVVVDNQLKNILEILDKENK